MKPELVLKTFAILVKYIGLILPVAIGVAIYYIIEDSLIFVLAFYFFMLSRSQLELFDKLEEINDRKAEEQAAWKSMLNKRKSL